MIIKTKHRSMYMCDLISEHDIPVVLISVVYQNAVSMDDYNCPFESRLHAVLDHRESLYLRYTRETYAE